MRSFFVLLLLGSLLAVGALVVRSGWLARSNPGKPINGAMREALNTPVPSWNAAEEASVLEKFPGAKKTASGLYFIVRSPGEDGATPTEGARVMVNYEGRFLDGTKFDSSYDRNAPILFAVGIGNVIKGWDEALLGMKKGEKRTLIVPYWLGYGEQGRGPIPPRATLVFDVELVKFSS